MKTLDVYWHLYRRDQLKPAFRGHLLCVLEVPPVAGVAVLRNILDPTGRDFPLAGRAALAALWERRHHGIIFEGVCKSAVYELVSLDPVIQEECPRFTSYNREIVRNARQFLLAETDHGLQGMPVCTARLLRGDLPRLNREPVRASD